MTADPDKTIPETVLHPLLLSMAKKFLEMYPNMSFEELVLRCMAKSGLIPKKRSPLSSNSLSKTFKFHERQSDANEPQNTLRPLS
jgi:hypothetical protein